MIWTRLLSSLRDDRGPSFTSVQQLLVSDCMGCVPHCVTPRDAHCPCYLLSSPRWETHTSDCQLMGAESRDVREFLTSPVLRATIFRFVKCQKHDHILPALVHSFLGKLYQDLGRGGTNPSLITLTAFVPKVLSLSSFYM